MELSADQKNKLINTLKIRFQQNQHRHKGLDWASIQVKLDGLPKKLWSLHEMEKTGGEPDVIAIFSERGGFELGKYFLLLV